MKKLFNLCVSLMAIFIILTAIVDAEAGPWIEEPDVFNFLYGEEGPDGILGTADDLPAGGMGIFSGYTDGTYMGPAGFVLTADVSLTSDVIPMGGGNWFYVWEITNSGTGPLVQFLGPNPPNFLQDPPLYGTAGPDRIPGTIDDVLPETEVDSMWGGPPIVAFWGGVWNPQTSLEAQIYQPTPEPSTWLLFCFGIFGFVGIKRKVWKA